MNFIDEIKKKYSEGSPLIRIIIINIAVFVLGLLVKIFLNFGGSSGTAFFYKYLGLPLEFSQVIFKPWTFITYMFIHDGIWHIVWNMVFLYWFGNIVNDLIGQSKITAIYIYGGIAGAFLALLLSLTTLVPSLPLVGASGAVNAVMLAAVILAPDYSFNLLLLGRVKIKYIAAVKLIMDLASISSLENTGGHICHLGGAAFGWFFITQLRTGNDLAISFNNFLNKIEGLFKQKRKVKVVYRNENSKHNTDSSKPINNRDKQKKVDSILDKISKSGYSSLTDEEKEFLFRESKN